ncbi:MAG: hypothetical protein ACYCZF_13605 [Anaerolineae bacterium]
MVLCVALLIACAARCFLRRVSSIPPAVLQPVGWQEIQVRTVSLEVQRSFCSTTSGFSRPIDAMVRRNLAGLGLSVVTVAEAPNDALRIQLYGVALAEDYQAILGKADWSWQSFTRTLCVG